MNTTEQRQKLKSALLDLGRSDYETIRTNLISELGYDKFREIQNAIFKEIGTISFEETLAPRNYKSQLWKEFGDVYAG